MPTATRETKVVYDPQHAEHGCPAFWRCDSCRSEFGHGGQTWHHQECQHAKLSGTTDVQGCSFVVGDEFIRDVLDGREHDAPVTADELRRLIPSGVARAEQARPWDLREPAPRRHR